MEAEEYPPFTWRQFLVVFGLGVVLFSYSAWSLASYGRTHRGYPSILISALVVGVFCMCVAFVGSHLQNREARKPRRANP